MTIFENETERAGDSWDWVLVDDERLSESDGIPHTTERLSFDLFLDRL